MKRPRHLRLVSTFAIGSLIAFAVIGVALSVVVSRQLRNRQEASAQFHAQFVADSILRYELSPQELAFLTPLTGNDRNEMYKFVATRVLKWPIVRVKVWRSDGVVIRSPHR